MATIKVLAGDFRKADSIYSFGSLYLMPIDKEPTSIWKGYPTEIIETKQIEILEIASEENVKKIGGTVGWGAAGAIVLGPAGLLAGLLLGGNKKEVTFVAKLKDGRKLLATTDSNTYTKLQSAVF
ncbi:MAG: hypothetical protein KUF77_11640 [Candidatus Thiodiazotropha sp. (ex Lucina aurantia)]|nr:hypothetical protein [Candidatus Thiodiazotropha taylori]MBV2098757.1 hypothetical protein [Candidatus Thiodiazotropha sp. (ex Codakia orbicularis)]MBV2103667.1 hypothetical protein [Candidatus Thiodiazotropha sp. (ex Lucina aurantia)]MBV2118106.1 hypothetical protein [Candidatus Thiodiazotropha sp. (ex Lucina aurantia)]